MENFIIWFWEYIATYGQETRATERLLEYKVEFNIATPNVHTQRKFNPFV